MIRITEKETYTRPSDDENTILRTKAIRIRGFYEVPAALLALYGGYKLINYIFTDNKKKKSKDETE